MILPHSSTCICETSLGHENIAVCRIEVESYGDLNSRRIYDRSDLLSEVVHVAVVLCTEGNLSLVGHKLVNVFNVGSTAALGTIDFEPGLQRDLLAILDKLASRLADKALNHTILI
jgi:hypothetical protein